MLGHRYEMQFEVGLHIKQRYSTCLYFVNIVSKPQRASCLAVDNLKYGFKWVKGYKKHFY